MANQREDGDFDEMCVNFRGRGMTQVPSSLFSMENIRRVDLSSNVLTRFPGSRVSQELPYLEVLVLSNNLLHVLEDILALASAPRLCELDLRDNPLRLSHNRLYLLESLLFSDTDLDEEILRELHRDERLKKFSSASQPAREVLYRSRLPRRRVFPMLQLLNREWITDSESRQVELERGKALESFDGSRMTVKQMLRNEARITAIPLPQVLKRYQIDAESSQFSPECKPSCDLEPWNYPISTFDDLHSDERHYVRYKSKHVAGTLERDDHFFESTTFLDCVAQCERSRRLTIRAVDHLTQPLGNKRGVSSNPNATRRTKSIPDLPISEATANLTDNLTANFSKRQTLESFKQVALRQKTNQLLSSQATIENPWQENPHTIEAGLEESLSKVKLRNAVDLANTLGGSKEHKRLFQALIDADAKVIEEERVTEEHKAHRQRLRRIKSPQEVNTKTRRDVELAKKLASLHAESPWQTRNWKAKVKLVERKRDENDHNVPATQAAKFRTIETVERAAQDSLVEVNSHDLLVRCSEIRQHKDKHVKALATYRDHFLHEEAEWQHMRQDPINVVRRHLRRQLYQDVQQIQIGSVEYVYSPVFQ
ncbi:uncharacterized protein PITG_16096 [Phytophthora infestans T30-4]|uniref:Leucine-rich repeat-containing protein n=1 Tax=Phytophthora infestans (strain T30-4) TaxID=403677 RepID=D0NSV6_PHYIT|nr:uncharacterized protein PITG_16096 [Phytophthora infestans T30-4]EEY64668.1 conserved hypothetical protein [Phytophthora infestans T30-4]|eukprot:XP_002897868.1 conserved hypothetical protein [Phytophthora infestans T30-4]